MSQNLKINDLCESILILYQVVKIHVPIQFKEIKMFAKIKLGRCSLKHVYIRENLETT